ncbi:MAG: hypothetical protein WAS05_03605 [Candidatus Nanopelagicales bacterium]
MKKKITIGLGALMTAVALTLTACGGGSDSSQSGSENEQTLSTYFNAFATNDATQMEPMLKAAEPGSPAEVYAKHQINTQVANESANETDEPDVAEIDGDTVSLHPNFSDEATDEEKKDATTIYKDFVFSSNGLIETWTTEPGGLLTPRISAQTGKATQGKVTVQLQTAYVTNSGDLYVTWSAKNSGGKAVDISVAGYVNSDGRQVQVTSTPYQTKPISGSHTETSSTIENGKLGGKLIFQFDYQNQVSITVK